MAQFMGIDIMQEYQDLAIWEKFFTVYQPRTFIELGTGAGGSALFFAQQCQRIGARFWTVDHQCWIDFNHPLMAAVNMRASFIQTNIFEANGLTRVRELITTAARPMCLFCDNGDKPREFLEFAPYVEPGDFVAVHDYGTEFNDSDIGYVKVTRILEAECDARDMSKWLAMWYRRV